MKDPQRGPLYVLPFYWNVIQALPARFVSAAGLAFTIIGIVSTGLLVFNRPLAKAVSAGDGFSSWFAIAPVLGLTLLALLREIHKQYRDGVQVTVDARREDAISYEQERARTTAELEAARDDAQSARDELARVLDVRPVLLLGEPTEVDNQTLERTQLVPDSQFRGSVSVPPLIRVPLERLRVAVWRVPLTNKGGDAPSTHVKLMSIDRALAQGRWSGTLHLAGDNPDDHSPEAYVRSRGFLLPRDGVEEIDLVAVTKDPPYRYFIYAVESSDTAVEVTLGNAQTFHLAAFGGGTSEYQDYWVRVIGDPPRVTVERIH